MNHDVDQSRHQNRPSRQPTTNRRRSRVHVADADLVEASPAGITHRKTAAAKYVSIRKSPSPKNYRLPFRRGPLGSMPVFMTRGKRGSHERQVCGLPAAATNVGIRPRTGGIARWFVTVAGINVGALLYRNAEATMLMHTRRARTPVGNRLTATSNRRL